MHTLGGTAAHVAHVADVAQAHALLHGQEKVGLGDAGYQGVEKRAEVVERLPGGRWYVAAKRGKLKAMAEGKLKEAGQALEKAKAQVRAYVEPPFPRRQKPLPAPRNPLPGSRQEHRATPRALRAGQPGAGRTQPATSSPGINPPGQRKAFRKNRPQCAGYQTAARAQNSQNLA